MKCAAVLVRITSTSGLECYTMFNVTKEICTRGGVQYEELLDGNVSQAWRSYRLILRLGMHFRSLICCR
jgi:hypothetical protein